MTAHAKLMSPSSSARRIACPGSYVLEAPLPDTRSDASDDGTAMHEVASWCLGKADGSIHDPFGYAGRLITVSGDGEPKRTVEFTEDMAALVNTYVLAIRALAAQPGAELHVEERVDFSQYLGVPGQFGTADARIVLPAQRELQVHDLKTGYHRVKVERNTQLMLYGLGALDLTTLLHEVDTVRLFIHQPRHHDEPSEWALPVADLLAFAEEAKRATHACRAAQHCADGEGLSPRFIDTYLRPGDEQCRFCKAAGTCPAVVREVSTAVACVDDFEVLDPSPAPAIDAAVKSLPSVAADTLGRLQAVAPLVEIWLKAVRAETERRLLAGQAVPGFKLVQGKKGPRKWSDTEAAEQQLKTMRLKVEEMYDLKLISPTTAEKLTKAAGEEKPVLGPRQWTKLQSLITQSPGSPSVAPADDKRPALVMTPPADDFEVVEAQPAAAEPVALESLL